MFFGFARIRRQVRQQRASVGIPTLSAALALLIALPCAAIAVEPAEDFVKGLQDRGLHELALEYLDGLKSSPLADEATRKQIPYLRGVALIEQSRQSADPAARNRLLDDARKELEQYAEANPQSVPGAERNCSWQPYRWRAGRN